MPSLFDKLRQGLARTRAAFTSGMGAPLDRRRVDEELFADFERALLTADVGVEVTELLMARVRERVRDAGITDARAAETVLKEELVVLLAAAVERRDGGASSPPEVRAAKPHVIMVVGVNGAGKTTTIGKLAKREVEAGRRVLAGSCDTFRAASGEQLQVWAERAGVPVVRQRDGADPAAVAFDAVAAGEGRGVDVVLLDTAGRLHTRIDLMEELKKIQRVVGRRLPGAPHEVLLCLDATTGQNAIRQAREFDAALGVTGLILAKLDGTARGGVVVAIANDLGLPVDLVGVGEGIDDLVPFDPRAFADALFARENASPAESGR